MFSDCSDINGVKPCMKRCIYIELVVISSSNYVKLVCLLKRIHDKKNHLLLLEDNSSFNLDHLSTGFVVQQR